MTNNISSHSKIFKVISNLLSNPPLNKNPTNLNAIVEEIFKNCVESVVKDATISRINLEIFKDIRKTTNQKVPPEPNSGDLWIFGYGSLIWKSDFPYIDKKIGFIRGFQRRFYQNSIDHRGTPLKPGRVVTLIPCNSQQEKVFGVAYRISHSQKDEVLRHLDYREKNGYERCTLEFTEFSEKEHHSKFLVIMYIATADNESFSGDIWKLSDIAHQILSSAGPSGQNRDYLFYLAQSMRELFPGQNDEHLFELETLVKQKVYEHSKSFCKEEILRILNRCSNIDSVVDEIYLLLEKYKQGEIC